MITHSFRFVAPLAVGLFLAACSKEPSDGVVGENDNTVVGKTAGADAVNETSAPDDASADRDTDALNSRPGAATGSDGADDRVRQLQRIPTLFRGTWATNAGECNARNHQRFTVTDTGVGFFEGGGEATNIRRNSSALAVTYTETNESLEPGAKVVYFASLDGGGAMRVRKGNGDSIRFIRCTRGSEPSRSDDGAVTSGTTATVPARFRNLYALDRQACAEDYNYQTAFQNVRVRAKTVNFFETGGPVTKTEVRGNSIAITLDETVGDNTTRPTISFALNDDGTARYRAGQNEPVRAVVRCEE
ncbi:hypothetical protein [Pararhizobium mangrovi]|uniref:Lipoprotein n=1 Tax=Pararhizobium mangrovi TaxID=2590452 RepID=A0A506U2Y6_9HYPH|nr:hypothetical protein [Pararhizobium mangrovi]TPW27716.1 hypothetical protein FJU11_10765 [Pararhizobium mangrovi]